MSQLPLSSMDSQSPGALCALHPTRSAATICNRCGNYACELCFQVGVDRQDYCTQCLPRTETTVASRMDRLGAVILDQLFIILPLFMAIIAGRVLFGEDPGLVMGVLTALVCLGVELYMQLTHGQTVGKRLMGIKVVRTDGSPVSLGRLFLLRNVVPALIGSATCNIFSLVDTLAIFGEETRCLHDHIADTKVIDVPKD